MNKQDTYEHLKTSIIDGSIAQGQWLIERELCEQYSISRTPIREVLFRLESEGLVVQEPTKGFSVRKLTMEQVVEIFQTREALEDMSVLLACQKMTREVLDKLRRLRKQLDEVDVETQTAKHVKLGRTMHSIIRDVAGNSLLQELYVTVDNWTYLTVNLTVRSVKIEQQSQKAHLAIIDALLEQNSDLARERMRGHLRETCSLVVSEYFVGYMTLPH
ncbi:MAG: GntR family transcriptional regulator [Spirochaetales bacterium]|nr:GntR family transcriptional regulator [Spirochaetales bacterium]